MSNEVSLSQLTETQEAAQGQQIPQAPVAPGNEIPVAPPVYQEQQAAPVAPVIGEQVIDSGIPTPIAEEYVPVVEKLNDPHVPASMQGGLEERLAEMEAEAKELEQVYGTPEEIAKQQELEARKQEVSLEEALVDEKDISEVKKSNFNDVIIEEEEPTEEEKKDAPVIDLTSIKIKKPKKSSASYARIRKSRLASTQQVVLPNTALVVEMAGFSSPDLRNIATTIRTMDAYRAAEFRFKQIFNKIADTSIGKLTWDEFLRCTSLLEVNILYYGLFCSTYPDSNKYPGKCTNPECRQQFEFDYPNSALMFLKEDRREQARQAVLDVLKGVHNAKDLLENSEVNTINRVLLKESGTIVDLRHPSLYNELYDVLQNVTQDMMVSDSVTVDIMPFVEAVYVLDPVDGNYIQLESFDDKFMELSSLKESDDIVLSKNIGKIIEKYNIKFGFRDVSCPHCKAKMEDVEIDSIENLLFTTHQLLTLDQ